MTAEKFDVYTHVTNQIITQIEGSIPAGGRMTP